MSRINLRVAVIGVERLQAKIRRYDAAVTSGAVKGVNTVAAEVFAESQRRVPVATGDLKGSGRGRPPTEQHGSAGGGYGRRASAYALPVPEAHRTEREDPGGPARG